MSIHDKHVDWVRDGFDKAHLVKDGVVTRGQSKVLIAGKHVAAVAWCGLSLPDGLSPAPIAPRCAQCLAAVRRYMAEALVVPPEIVKEVMTIEVVRPADDLTFVEWIERHMANKRTWTFTIRSLSESDND